MYGVKAYRYNLSSSTYDRTFPAEDDCHKGNPPLPNGISDTSACYYGKIHLLVLYRLINLKFLFLGMSVAASFPHYLYGDEVIKSYVEGLEPDVEKHGSYVIVEPVSLLTFLVVLHKLVIYISKVPHIQN